MSLSWAYAVVGSMRKLFEYDTIANHDAYALELHFANDGVTIKAKERTHEAISIIEGVVQEP